MRQFILCQAPRAAKFGVHASICIGMYMRAHVAILYVHMYMFKQRFCLVCHARSRFRLRRFTRAHMADAKFHVPVCFLCCLCVQAVVK